ncbi:MAG TPA: DegV family protein [Candidatus Merdenecus merdavium]|nr:DegV family protein [Candidatus Merdenecus merdavium]
MNNYQIFCDSSCDLPDEFISLYHIVRIPFYVSFDKNTYKRELVDISLDEFYTTMTANPTFPSTSLPSVQDYINKFKVAIEQGLDILCICLSANFSGSYQSALNAKSILEEDYPHAKIEVINSIQATVGEGLTVLQAAYMQEAGYTLEETKNKLLELRKTSRILFTVDTLDYLQRGGRIGKVSSIAGTLLNLKPLIELKEGELLPYGTVRGRSKSLSRILEMTDEHFKSNQLSFDDYDFALATGSCEGDAYKLKEGLEDMIGRRISYPMFSIGITIGTYTGPDALGLCFIEKYNRNHEKH